MSSGRHAGTAPRGLTSVGRFAWAGGRVGGYFHRVGRVVVRPGGQRAVWCHADVVGIDRHRLSGVLQPHDDALSARGKSRAGAKNGDCHQFAPRHDPRNKALSLKRIGWLYPIFRVTESRRISHGPQKIAQGLEESHERPRALWLLRRRTQPSKPGRQVTLGRVSRAMNSPSSETVESKERDLAPQVGLEPTTLRLTAGCSTN